MLWLFNILPILNPTADMVFRAQNQFSKIFTKYNSNFLDLEEEKKTKQFDACKMKILFTEISFEITFMKMIYVCVWAPYLNRYETIHITELVMGIIFKRMRFDSIRHNWFSWNRWLIFCGEKKFSSHVKYVIDQV